MDHAVDHGDHVLGHRSEGTRDEKCEKGGLISKGSVYLTRQAREGYTTWKTVQSFTRFSLLSNGIGQQKTSHESTVLINEQSFGLFQIDSVRGFRPLRLGRCDSCECE